MKKHRLNFFFKYIFFANKNCPIKSKMTNRYYATVPRSEKREARSEASSLVTVSTVIPGQKREASRTEARREASLVTVSTVIPGQKREAWWAGSQTLRASETTKQAACSCHSLQQPDKQTSKQSQSALSTEASRKKNLTTTTTCLADKTNHPVERLSLNRSQCGSCSTKYDTSAGT